MMTSTVIPCPTPPPATCARPAGTDTRPPGAGLPVARVADPDECGTALTITVDDRGRSAALRVRGEIDLLTAADLRAALHERLASGAGTVVVDLRDVWFVDCAGLGLLVEARQRADRAGVRLRIVPGRALARTAALLGLTAALGLPGR